MDVTPLAAPRPGEPIAYAFADTELDVRTRTLVTSGRSRHLERKTFELLQYLIVNRGRVVTKHELNQTLWGGCAVSDGALTQCVWTARRAISGEQGRRSLIQTLNGIGYRFVGEVVVKRVAPPEEGQLAVDALSHLALAQQRAAAGKPSAGSSDDYLREAALACRRFADAILGGLGMDQLDRSMAS